MTRRRPTGLPSVWILGVLAIAALVLLMLVSPGAAGGTGSFDVNGSIVRIDIARPGLCQPGSLGPGTPDGMVPSSGITPATPKLIQTSDVEGFRGCIASLDEPQPLVIDNELVLYANVHAQTVSKPVNATTESFYLYVNDCQGFPRVGNKIYVGMELMTWDQKSCNGTAAPDDWFHITTRPDFRPGEVLPGEPARQAAHPAGSFVRSHGWLKLVARKYSDLAEARRPDLLRLRNGTRVVEHCDVAPGVPKYFDYTERDRLICPAVPNSTDDPQPYTPAAEHVVGAPLRSPTVYSVCIAKLTQTPVAGADDTVTASTRCSPILEPGYNPTGCADTSLGDCYWKLPVPPLPELTTRAPMVRRPVFPLVASIELLSEVPGTTMAYDLLTGTIDDQGAGTVAATGALHFPVPASCSRYLDWLSDSEHVNTLSEMDIPKPGATVSGTIRITVFVVPLPDLGHGCDDPNSAVLTVTGTVSVTNLPPTADTDGDGCPDYVSDTDPNTPGDQPGGELSDDVSQGGKRDPLSPFDYMNAEGDGENRISDVSLVISEYFHDDPNPNDPDLNSATDRTAIGPNLWNLGKPNGSQRVDDIISQVKQYFHDCS